MSGGNLWESPAGMTVPHTQVDFHLLLLQVARRFCSLIVWCQEKYTCVFSVHRNLCEVSAHLQTWDQREEFKLVECVIDFVRTFSGNKFKSIILSIYKYTLYIGYKFDFSFCLSVLSEAPKLWAGGGQVLHVGRAQRWCKVQRLERNVLDFRPLIRDTSHAPHVVIYEETNACRG